MHMAFDLSVQRIATMVVVLDRHPKLVPEGGIGLPHSPYVLPIQCTTE